MGTTEAVRDLVARSLGARDELELYDVELSGGTVRVLVDRQGGVDIETLGQLTRDLSAALDRVDLIPGRYLLEVSSPGLERTLRTPHHFVGAVGSPVQVKTVAGTEGERRIAGTLTAADEEGITVDGRRLAYTEIERARTTYDWPQTTQKKRAARS